jgi:hypothetical protein
MEGLSSSYSSMMSIEGGAEGGGGPETEGGSCFKEDSPSKSKGL